MREIEPDNKWEDEGGYIPREKDDGYLAEQLEINTEPSTDPLAPENIGAVQTITLLRIYDVLMAQLTEKDPDAAERLHEIHSRGGLVQESIGFNYGE